MELRVRYKYCAHRDINFMLHKVSFPARNGQAGKAPDLRAKIEFR